jgi:structural maintenance of chromosome 1
MSQDDHQVDLDGKQMKQYMALQAQVDRQTFKQKEELKIATRQFNSVTETVARLETTIVGNQSHRENLIQQVAQFTQRDARLQESLVSSNATLRELQKKRHSVDGERKRLHQLKLETNEKLEETMNRLMQAKSDRQESHRNKKFKETLETLTRLFPGVHGRLLDLCKPTQRKFDLAVSIILGKNMDAIGIII